MGNNNTPEPVVPSSHPTLGHRMPQKMMTTNEVAAYLSMSRQRIYMMTHMREIPHHKIGRSVLFDRREIDHWIDDHKIAVKEKSHL